MKPSDSESIYLVDSTCDPVVLKIKGRASYLNCNPLNNFFDCIKHKDVHNVVIDFADCTGMDSTFLGLITGAALDTQEADTAFNITLCNLGKRNRELVYNLGLDKLLEIADSLCQEIENHQNPNYQSIQTETPTANQSTILKAHENLIAAQSTNKEKFEDVISFLKNAEKKSS